MTPGSRGTSYKPPLGCHPLQGLCYCGAVGWQCTPPPEWASQLHRGSFPSRRYPMVKMQYSGSSVKCFSIRHSFLAWSGMMLPSRSSNSFTSPAGLLLALFSIWLSFIVSPQATALSVPAYTLHVTWPTAGVTISSDSKGEDQGNQMHKRNAIIYKPFLGRKDYLGLKGFTLQDWH